jgi:hypothetical protein
MRMKFGLRNLAGLTGIAAAAALVFAGIALGVSGAINSTDDPGFTGIGVLGSPAACLNGQPGHTTPAVNCNIYAAKEDVFLSGSPIQAALGDGTYFFDVLVPGGQPTPNDAATVPDTSQATAKNLSDDFDAWSNREFTVTGGTIAMLNASSHAYDSATNEVQVAPFANTTNNGGVYILAVCKVPASPTGTPGVDPRDCKYDAFKVRSTNTTPPAADLIVTKDATPTFARTYSWDAGKSVDRTRVEQAGGSATFNYTVTATWSGPTDSGWKVDGTISVFNPNAFGIGGVTVTDAVDNGGDCAVTGGSNATIAAETTVDFAYECTYASAPDPLAGTNTATATWDGTQYHTPSGSANFAIDFAFDDGSKGNPTVTNDETTVSDTFNGGSAQALGVAGVAPSWVKDAGNNLTGFAESYSSATHTFTLTYSRSIPIPAHGCLDYTNTATESTLTDSTTPDSVTVTVCGPANNSALTIGFWKTTNGQALLKTYSCPASKTSLANYLKGLGAGAGPFTDATGCDLSTYVSGILTKATATNMNTMLKAQMLATALDVYFSDPALGYSAVASGSGKNQIKPPSSFLTQGPLGGFSMDLTAICPMIDNTTTGTATCKNNLPSTNGVTSGAFPASPQTVQWILDFAAKVDVSPWTNGAYSGSNVWYGGNKTLEEILKNTFDQINNNEAFAG